MIYFSGTFVLTGAFTVWILHKLNWNDKKDPKKNIPASIFFDITVRNYEKYRSYYTPVIIKFLYKVETLIIAYTSKLNMVPCMSNPVDILACAVTSAICFLILYTILQMDILILGIVLVGCILFGKTLYLF